MCVGPRSAVFAPMRDVGLVVVDEEHDASYKHEGDPRYDARRVAERRAAQAGAVLVAGSATPRPESVHALARVRLPAARRRRAAAAGRDRRHARGAARAASADPRGAGRRAQGDRPAQPPRLVELPDLPLVRARVGLPVVRRHPGHAPRRRAAGLPSLRPPRAGARALRRLRLGLDRPPRHRDRAPGGRARGDGLPPRRRGRRSRPRARRLRAGAARRARRHADGGQGPRLPRRRPRRRARRRRDAALPRLPRRGAHLRARHPARRARRTRSRARGPRARADPGPRGAVDPLRRAPRRRRLPRRRARAPARAALSAVLDADPRGLLLARRRGRRWPPRPRCASAWATPSGPAPLFRLRGRERAQIVVKAQDRAAAVAEVGAAVQAAAGDRAHRAAAFSVDVDPQ